VPTRIAAAVPGGLKEFNRALIFFHPLPTKRAGYERAVLRADRQLAQHLRYCDQQGAQLAVSKRKLVFIFPIFNLAATETCRRFPDEWKSFEMLCSRLLRCSCGFKCTPISLRRRVGRSRNAPKNLLAFANKC
jgi:hypothetical protein